MGEEDGDNSVQKPVGGLKESGAFQFKRDVLRQNEGILRQEHCARAPVTLLPYLIDRRRLIWAEVILTGDAIVVLVGASERFGKPKDIGAQLPYRCEGAWAIVRPVASRCCCAKAVYKPAP